MDPAYWQGRWERGETGWHKAEVNPYLVRHWAAAGVAPGAKVLVPLCGKTLDLGWLAEQGHPVLGVEISALGAEAFFAEAGLTPARRAVGPFTVLEAQGVAIAVGDFFALPALADELADVGGLYDRAALIALPPERRGAYAAVLCGALPAAARGLTITIAFEQAKKPGPPFSVAPAEVRALFGDRFEIAELCDDDVLAHNPGFVAAGLASLREHAFALAPR